MKWLSFVVVDRWNPPSFYLIIWTVFQCEDDLAMTCVMVLIISGYYRTEHKASNAFMVMVMVWRLRVIFQIYTFWSRCPLTFDLVVSIPFLSGGSSSPAWGFIFSRLVSIEEIDKKLTAYRRGSKFWRMLIFCQVSSEEHAWNQRGPLSHDITTFRYILEYLFIDNIISIEVFNQIICHGGYRELV